MSIGGTVNTLGKIEYWLYSSDQSIWSVRLYIDSLHKAKDSNCLSINITYRPRKYIVITRMYFTQYLPLNSKTRTPKTMSLAVFIPFVLNFGSMLQRIVTEFSYLTDKSRKPNRSCFFFSRYTGAIRSRSTRVAF